jgi:hypothetical protein
MQSIKYTLAAASLAAIAEAQGTIPNNYTCTISASMMPQVTASIQTQGPYQFEIETNTPNNMVFTDFCTQEIDSTTLSYCADAPTYVTDSLSD